MEFIEKTAQLGLPPAVSSFQEAALYPWTSRSLGPNKPLFSNQNLLPAPRELHGPSKTLLSHSRTTLRKPWSSFSPL